MRVFEDKIEVTVEWKFTSDGRTLRSTVVGGYQGEIFKGNLKIFGPNSFVGQWLVGTRRYGRKKFTYIVRDMLRLV